MKIKRLLLVAVVVGAAACHGSDNTAVRKDQQYDVVQEGQASGVTSTINAPGENPPVASPPLTGTGADTTTAFNSTPGMMSTAGAPAGTLAGTLPPPMPNAPAQRAPQQQPAQQPVGRPMTSSSTVVPQPSSVPRHATPPQKQPEMAPPPTTTDDQTTTSSDEPKTDTTKTDTAKTDTAKTDTTSTEPPPPPPPPPPSS